MSENEQSKKGLTPEDPRIKDYILYAKGGVGVPSRFWDYILINVNRPFDEQSILHTGFHKEDLNNIINRYEGISFEYLGN